MRTSERRVKVSDLSARGEKKGNLGTLILGMWGVGELVADGEVNRQIQIYNKLSALAKHDTVNPLITSYFLQ